MKMKTTSNTTLKYFITISLLILSCGTIPATPEPVNAVVPPTTLPSATIETMETPESTLVPAITIEVAEVLPTPVLPLTINPVEIPNANIIYYDISGSTQDELRAQLNALGPVGFDGYKGDATTDWFIRWNWPGYGTSTCNLSAAIISHDIKVIFPRWIPPEDASPELIAKWANYSKLLAEHEKGHVDSVLKNFPDVVNAIKSATCETADSVGNELLNQIRQLDIDYDAHTRHGATQGAIFP
jgi:predicted secreted Zn-dependent protease